MSSVTAHQAFDFIKSSFIDSLHLEVQEFRHGLTGARHIHLASEQKENVFLVALRTVPTDSTGVAHILEHTTLCGSQRYPVRDPFFMMTRRSLNTFMNAFTSSDWTAYPFASQNEKDYFNLLDVYLDAVFFANLNELDFAQEGHRLEFSAPDDPTSELVYKGVVYNEMKGAMSSPVSQLWAAYTRHMYPTSTYHFNSGGEPDHIPDLSYAQLKSFYNKHYHPSNALFMTFGNLPAETLQEVFQDKALKHFDGPGEQAFVSLEKRYFAPVRALEHYPLPPSEETEKKAHVVVGWLLSESSDPVRSLEAHLLSNVLMENSASPLMKALETTELGHAPSNLCGLEDSFREMTLVCGLEGAEARDAEAIESLILSTLKRVAEEGVAMEKVEAVLHQLELSQREISGDSYPYGLQLILSSLSATLLGEDPVDSLDIGPALEKLRQRIQDPAYIRTLVKELLLENPHRVTLTLAPDTQLEERREEYIRQQLAEKKAALSEEGKQAIVEQAAQLLERQNQQDDESVLPRVTLEDVPSTLHIADPVSNDAELELTNYAQGTNGLVYHQAIVALPSLSEEEFRLLPLLSFCLPEVGVGEDDYLVVQERQAAYTGGIGAYWELKGDIHDEQTCKGFLVVSGKALSRYQEELVALMRDTLKNARFDEKERVEELLAQLASRREQGVTSNGHGLAMAAAASKLSPANRIAHYATGLEGVAWAKNLDQEMKEAGKLERLCEALSALHSKIAQQPVQFVAVAEPAGIEPFSQVINQAWAKVAPATASQAQPLSLDTTRSHVRQGWITNSQISFCAKAYATVPTGHADAAALTVLGHYLRNGFLHRAIREQGGAYGSGASQDSANGVFRFYSYRDPRIAGTLEDFDASVKWLLNQENDEEGLEQAILGVVASIDKPRSPAGEAKSAFHSNLFGRTPEQRREFRDSVLGVRFSDLKRVAQEYLSDQEHSVAVVSGEGAEEEFAELGLDLHRL